MIGNLSIAQTSPPTSRPNGQSTLTIYLQGATALSTTQTVMDDLSAGSPKVISVTSNSDGKLIYVVIGDTYVTHFKEFVKTKSLDAYWITEENGEHFMIHTTTDERLKLKSGELDLISTDL